MNVGLGVGNRSLPVILFLCGHPGGELGTVEGRVQALEGRLEADLKCAGVQVQRGPEELFQSILQVSNVFSVWSDDHLSRMCRGQSAGA